MNSKITALLAVAALCAVSAVSCGKDEKSSSDVVLDINNITTASAETTTTSEGDEKTSTTAVTTKETKKTTAATTASGKAAATTTTAAPDNNNDEPDNTDEPQDGDSPSNDDPQPDEPQGNQSADPEPQQPQGGSFSDSDLSFNGTALLSNADGLISSLGTPNDVLEAPGCLSNGADQKIYKYGEVEVSCYVMDGSETVYDIMITGSGYSTSKGITVGSSRSDVEAAYGTGSGGANEVIYGSASYGMIIGYSGDSVSWIAIHADV